MIKDIKYLLILLLSIFKQINSMEQKCKNLDYFSNVPVEMKLHILEQNIRDIIENSSIFELVKSVKGFIDNIILINKDFNILRINLTKFTKKYAKKYFASEHINLLQEEKDLALYNIFKNFNIDNSKELEIEIAKLIIAGASPNIIINIIRGGSDFQLSPLIYLSRFSNIKNLLDLLIKYGADINAQDNYGCNILMLEIYYKRNYGIVNNLLDYNNIDIFSKTKCGTTVLMVAAKSGDVATISKLLKHNGIDINTQDSNGDTALMFAVKQDNLEALKIILNHDNVNLNIKNNLGNTALILSVLYANKEHVKILLTHKADINIKNNNGWTVLISALYKGRVDLVELILENKDIDINALDNNSKAAKDIAIKKNLTTIIQLINNRLAEHKASG